MKRRNVPEITVLSFELKTTLKDIKEKTNDIRIAIVKEAVNNNLHPTGPQHWVYTWFSEDMEAEFLLKICLPVATFGATYTNGKFKLERLPAFKCASEEHQGDWLKLAETYSKLMPQIKAEGLKPGNVCREVYINCDFENVDNNLTEVQFEII